MKIMDAYMDVLFFDETQADEQQECEVQLNDQQLVISYNTDDDLSVVYKGRNRGDGHFELTCPMLQGRATLHQSPGSKILEGYWHEEGYRGMWRIHLL